LPLLHGAISTALVEHPGARIVVSSYLRGPCYFQTILENAGADGVLSVRARVENDYSNEGFDSIDAGQPSAE
jgi:hypothetical protein